MAENVLKSKSNPTLVVGKLRPEGQIWPPSVRCERSKKVNIFCFRVGSRQKFTF